MSPVSPDNFLFIDTEDRYVKTAIEIKINNPLHPEISAEIIKANPPSQADCLGDRAPKKIFALPSGLAYLNKHNGNISDDRLKKHIKINAAFLCPASSAESRANFNKMAHIMLNTPIVPMCGSRRIPSKSSLSFLPLKNASNVSASPSRCRPPVKITRKIVNIADVNIEESTKDEKNIFKPHRMNPNKIPTTGKYEML
jgi:hypothetical protein